MAEGPGIGKYVVMQHPLKPWITVAVLALLGVAGCSDDPGAADGVVSFPDGGIAMDMADNPTSESVFEHHKSKSRDGLYVQRTITRAAARTFHLDPTFVAPIDGPTYAQPLFMAASENAPGGKDVLFIATEKNQVSALSAKDGAVVWQRKLGTPVPLAALPCGNIDPLGVTGTPIIDAATRTMYLDAMITPDGGPTKRHMIYALSIDDGKTRMGWPIDVNATATANGHPFVSEVQNQRGALSLMGGTLYIPYGGHGGDCASYFGWVVGIPTIQPGKVGAWATRAPRGGGIWAPGGLSSDGAHIYATTGNTFSATTWSDGEAVFRFGPGPTSSGQTADYFAPKNWKALDDGDVDLSGSGPILMTVAGSTPSQVVIALGKDGNVYLLNRQSLGGISDPMAMMHASSTEIINAAAAYTTPKGSYVVFKGQGVGCPAGNLIGVKIVAGSPPTLAPAFCADQHGDGSPMVSTTDGQAESVVWAVGSEKSERLYAFNGDTGEVLLNGGGAGDKMTFVRRFVTPIAAQGKVYVAGDDRIYAFVPR